MKRSLAVLASAPVGAAALTVFSLLSPAALAQVDPHGGMLRFPDVGPTHITFVYANDIWIVPREGGMASPLASPPGRETFPRFSADGSTIAFMGNYDGGSDLYTISLAGGVPTRVTHHPAGETLCDWTADGRLVFSSIAVAPMNRQPQLMRVAAAGGMPERLPVPYGEAGAISPDGVWLAYTPFNADSRTWKRYRGGWASDIWLFNLSDHSARQMTDWEGTDSIPMWVGNKLYYMSDGGPEHRLNIWSYDPATGQRAQVTRFADFDIKWPSVGPGPNGQGEIVFQYGASLYLLDLATGNSRPVSVTIPGDRPTLRERSVDVSDMLQGGGISSTGKRVVAQARGDLFTVPAENGVTRKVTDTDGVFERNPVWSPDGRWIAYFSDATDEYEVYVTQSDGKGETRQLTKNSTTFYTGCAWSPDSKHLLMTDKAGHMWMHTLESSETKLVDTDPVAFDFGSNTVSWSHDSGWVAYSLARPGLSSAIWLYEVKTGEKHQVTSGVFPDSLPTFDRKGDYLYFVSSRAFAPTYSDLDTTWIYNNSQVLLAVPLRNDITSPFAPKNDEEEFKVEEDKPSEDAAKEDKAGEAEDAEKGDEAADEEATDDPKKGEDTTPPAPADDGVSGTWTCTLTGNQLPPGGFQVTVTLSVSSDGAVTGSVSTPMGGGTIVGRYEKATGDLNGTITTDEGESVTLTAKITNGTLTGTVSAPDFSGELTGTRTSIPAAAEGDEEKPDDADKPAEEVKIDLDGFERRAMPLPVSAGGFSQLAVNNQNQLIYGRTSTAGGASAPEIKLFDINAETKTEQTVASGAASFDMSGDGKKLLIGRGNSLSIQPASAGGSGKPVSLAGLTTDIDPRAEWRQLFADAWRLERIYFYDPTMHGVDWSAVRAAYAPMIEDCVNRDDVAYVISEMISELNVGHAYYGGGDLESGPSQSVGMLGVDFELHEGAYRISKIHEGAVWDSDARGPLSQPGVNVKPGEYLLAVDGVPMDTSKDPWAAFVGKANRPVLLTISDKPLKDDTAREVLVTTLVNEGGLRYRAWIESNRKHVEEATGGRVGYIHVPDTGFNGQTNLVRQLVGQRAKEALIIDERWNGGGQIPDRFIELLNRPVRNYWARRDQGDWMWPPDASPGPKCMLINGPSGSGGDAFPYYFKQSGLGKLIGRRTWGGLVGISGTPGLIDNAQVTAPTFAFYENDGTWGIEGHGVDPDIDVLDDPSKMATGGDPQLDAAIQHMLEELKTRAYVKPARPAYPDRSGMGIEERDK